MTRVYFTFLVILILKQGRWGYFAFDYGKKICFYFKIKISFSRCDRRKTRIFLLIMVTIFNFAFGLFLISSVLSIAEDEKDQGNELDNQ